MTEPVHPLEISHSCLKQGLPEEWLRECAAPVSATVMRDAGVGGSKPVPQTCDPIRPPALPVFPPGRPQGVASILWCASWSQGGYWSHSIASVFQVGGRKRGYGIRRYL